MSDAFKDDSWISKKSPIAPAKLHALGLMNYRWNIADFSLKALLSQISRVEFATMWAIIHETGDQAITSAIIEIMDRSNVPNPVKESVLHGLKLYDRNRVNRNQLTHFLPGAILGSDLTRLKGPRFDPRPLPDDISDLRRVAEDIENLLVYMSKLMNIIVSRDYSQNPGGKLPLLPDAIPLPELIATPHPQRDPKSNRSPQKAGAANRPPSVLRLTEEEWIAKYRKEGRPLPEKEGG